MFAMDLTKRTQLKMQKQKRERQPNWTEAEKQLLISLTRNHQAILENKGSDAITIKRKSLAWDDIAIHMAAAGFQRTKERLKQQLGRIRAAESKRARDILGSASDKNRLEKITYEEVQIKIEKVTASDDGFESATGIRKNNCEPIDIATEPQNIMKSQSYDENTDMYSEAASTSNSQASTNNKIETQQCSSISRSPSTRAQRISQLHGYRVAFERERLKAFRLQEKRDRMLYHGDMQIQKLKLQILRNLAEQSKSSHIYI